MGIASCICDDARRLANISPGDLLLDGEKMLRSDLFAAEVLHVPGGQTVLRRRVRVFPARNDHRATRVERYAVDGLHLRRCHRRSRALFRGSATATGAISLRCPSSPRVARPGALQLPHARRQIAATSFTPTGVSADRTTETTAPAPPACRRVLFWHPRDPTRATPPDPRVPSIHLGLWHMRHRLFAPRQRVVTHVCARQAP